MAYDWWGEETLVFVDGDELRKYDLDENSSSYLTTIKVPDFSEGADLQVVRDNLYFMDEDDFDANSHVYKLDLNNPAKLETVFESKTMDILEFKMSPNEKYAVYSTSQPTAPRPPLNPEHSVVFHKFDPNRSQKYHFLTQNYLSLRMTR